MSSKKSAGFVWLLIVSLVSGAVLAACGEDDARWEMGRESLGGEAIESERIAEEWSMHRDDVVRSLDYMQSALTTARGASSVADSAEIDTLSKRIQAVREEAVALVDATPDTVVSSRKQLRSHFAALRTDVDALLTRLGHNPDDIARWQDN